MLLFSALDVEQMELEEEHRKKPRRKRTVVQMKDDVLQGVPDLRTWKCPECGEINVDGTETGENKCATCGHSNCCE